MTRRANGAARSAKIAISLPRPLVQRLETLRRRTGETRSAFVQRALWRMVRDAEREEMERRYAEGYRKRPESAREVAAAEAAARALLAREPW